MQKLSCGVIFKKILGAEMVDAAGEDTKLQRFSIN